MVSDGSVRAGSSESLPDRDIDLFIRLCLQNHGKLSKVKRESAFRILRDDEIERLERCVADG